MRKDKKLIQKRKEDVRRIYQNASNKRKAIEYLSKRLYLSTRTIERDIFPLPNKD